MSEGVMIFVMVLVVAMFIAMFLCVRKEKELVAFYKAIHVCGRWYAYFMADFLLAGAGSVIMLLVSFIFMLMGKLDAIAEEMGGMGIVFAIFALGALICLPIGLLMYRNALKKCPDNLKKGFLKDVMIMFFGTSFRIGFFFLAFIGFLEWWTVRPIEYTVNGKTCYTRGNSDELYDEHGNRVGTKSGLNEAVMTDSRYKS